MAEGRNRRPVKRSGRGKGRRKAASRDSAETPPPTPEPSDERTIDRVPYEPGSDDLSPEELDDLEGRILEDAALDMYIQTQSYQMCADLLRRSKATVWRMVKRARERRRDEVLTLDVPQAMADLVAEYRFVQAKAMDEFIKAGPGTFQRNSFLQTFMQASRDKERMLREAGLIPRAPKEVDVNFREQRQTRATLASRIEQLPEGQRQTARVRLHRLLQRLKQLTGDGGEGAGDGGSRPALSD